MIDLQYIKDFYPPYIKANSEFDRHILKEYVELMALDYLTTQSKFAEKMTFIGGTNLRLVKGINRFSEDLDFDCKDFTKEEFVAMTDTLADNLRNNGLNVEIRDKDNSRLTAFRRSIYFPHLLFDLQLTGHREERFLMKIEAQDQGVDYERKVATIDRCGFHITVPVPPDEVLLSMKLAALLARGKGRDFYDVMFLWQQTEPSYEFLKARCNIADSNSLREAIEKCLGTTNLEMKVRDFQHLLLNQSDVGRIFDFPQFAAKQLSGVSNN